MPFTCKFPGCRAFTRYAHTACPTATSDAETQQRVRVLSLHRARSVHVRGVRRQTRGSCLRRLRLRRNVITPVIISHVRWNRIAAPCVERWRSVIRCAICQTISERVPTTRRTIVSNRVREHVGTHLDERAERFRSISPIPTRSGDCVPLSVRGTR